MITVVVAVFVRCVTGFCLVSSGLESLSREDLLALLALQQRQIEDLKSTVAALNDKVRDPYYGPQLAALAVYLLVYQHVPVERAAELITDVTGAAPSTGWIASQLVKSAGLVDAPNKLIMALLVLARVLHADETATNVAGAKSWLHVACADKLALFTLAPRSKAGTAVGGVLPNATGTMVHDALWLYRGFPDADHQLCCAHVIRELTACDERYPGQIWAPQLRWVIAEMINEADRARTEGLDHVPPERLRRWEVYYNSAVQVGLEHHPVNLFTDKQSKETNLLLRLTEHKDEYLRFTRDLAVPATNNQAERDLRPIKTQLKISGCHAAKTGAENWLAVRSYIVTAIKHGLGAFDAIRQAVTGQAWMPPIELA